MEQGSAFHSLREAREAAGLSLADVAERTKMRPNVLSALESGDLGALPERPIARSYLRRYASELRLDPAPLLAEHDRLAPQGAEIVDVMRAKMAARRGPALPLGLVAGALSGLAVVLALGWWGYAAWQARAVPPDSSTLLMQPAGNTASVSLTLVSNPSGARVYLDNRDLGPTPVRDFPIEPRASAELRVEFSGYKPAVKKVALNRNRILRAHLVPQGQTGGNSFLSDAGAESGAQGGAERVSTERVPAENVPAEKVSALATNPAPGVTLHFAARSWVRVTAPGGQVLFEGLPAVGSVRTFPPGVTVRAGSGSAVLVGEGAAAAPLGPDGQTAQRTLR